MLLAAQLSQVTAVGIRIQIMLVSWREAVFGKVVVVGTLPCQ